ncbi:bacitracin ABC transporter ATP-binding protein [Bacillus amyloliquefaciens]|uniref:ATP-binding cassette domain-containing protein n=2 Tax=Bacillus velezensis TaxID=492670 RepID=A0A6A8LI36_BACVE|nr:MULTISPECIES: ABC transporter ATP-binding protein [Bacillus]AKF29847.1 bacitracin ABC transporter ATP-binding protein [Bacillus velezensis]ALV04167.1 bacitracin ABC transporter ATP-binding protein [Bacillus amyloliquefaciens]APB81396.1 bacitracin ABC transporter ATP-binding protein [Bacillus amyloliquefaciens]ASF54452.1 ABC transporter ATP-binding protein [Bacillus velezensis]AVX18098.1 ABC transporter ATP-binding protein [Bacillus sp. ZY-1-1]
METVLELQQVKKTIKGRTIIHDLSFSVRAGEVFGFLGPNGAGKTTTIRMMVGLMKLSQGDIVICGESITKNYAKAVRHVGAIVENPELYKFLSGYKNLQQYARMVKGVTKEKIDEVIELVGLQDRIHDKVKTYSLGMRQRLGLAQSLLHNPKVLILDEPTNGLDPAGIREIRDHLKKLTREKGMAVIVSSHLLSEMELMCDRIGILQKGELVDIQKVRDEGKEDKDTYFFHIEQREEALAVLSQFDCVKKTNGIEIQLSKQEVPDVISLLVRENIRLYEVKIMTKSLEDRFLEITGGTKEEVQYV